MNKTSCLQSYLVFVFLFCRWAEVFLSVGWTFEEIKNRKQLMTRHCERGDLLLELTHYVFMITLPVTFNLNSLRHLTQDGVTNRKCHWWLMWLHPAVCISRLGFVWPSGSVVQCFIESDFINMSPQRCAASIWLWIHVSIDDQILDKWVELLFECPCHVWEELQVQIIVIWYVIK